jgi:hypothetical protein
LPDADDATPAGAEGTATLRHVVVSGASGLIGTALTESLRADGVRVTHLVRRPAERPDEVEWLTSPEPLDPAVLAGADAVVGLNGASIGRFPWTSRYRSTLLWSRVTPTRALARALRELGPGAPAFLSASAVGYYGNRPGERITESTSRGESFLADLCGEWEGAARAAGDDSRVVLLRTAPIVDRRAFLKPLIPLTKAGLSGPVGRGTQAWPWISLADEIAAIRFLLTADIEGPVNLTGPTRATANDIGFALAQRLHRPFVLRAPEWGLKLLLGADATEALLTNDQDVAPEVLQRAGFRFDVPTAEEAIARAVPAPRG